MTVRSVAQNTALMVFFLGVGMLTFSENVRTVQVLGLYVSGVASGVFLARAILAARSLRPGASGQ
jgi:hypothetical protein